MVHTAPFLLHYRDADKATVVTAKIFYTISRQSMEKQDPRAFLFLLLHVLIIPGI